MIYTADFEHNHELQQSVAKANADTSQRCIPDDLVSKHAPAPQQLMARNLHPGAQPSTCHPTTHAFPRLLGSLPP
jgi:hypothetical protein